MDDLAERLAALAPEVDSPAARAAFDRTRGRRRAQRRALAMLATVAVLAGGIGVSQRLLATSDPRGIEVEMGGDSTATTLSPEEAEEGCAALRVATNDTVVTSEVVAATGAPGPNDIDVPWYPGCRLRAEQRADDYALVDEDGRPLLDPRGVVWPELVAGDLPDDMPASRLSAAETATAFVFSVLGDGELRASDAEVTETPGQRCDADVVVPTSQGPVEIAMSRAVGRRWWSVCEVTSFGTTAAPEVLFQVEGRSLSIAVRATTDFQPMAATVRYGANEPQHPPIGKSELPFAADAAGSVIVNFYDQSSPAPKIGIWARPVPSNGADGTMTLGERARFDARGKPIVTDGQFLLGWWEAGQWVRTYGAVTNLYEPGEEFATISRIDDVGRVKAREATDRDRCAEGDLSTVVPLTTSLEKGIAVRGDWNVTPRSVRGPFDSPDARSVMATALAKEGLDVAVDEVAAYAVDLDGDGTEELVVQADHPEQQMGVSPVRGWWSAVAIQQTLEGEQIVSMVSSTIIRTAEDETYPNQEQHRIAAFADLNGDGTMEIVAHLTGFEWWSTTVHEFRKGWAPGTRPVLRTGCGV